MEHPVPNTRARALIHINREGCAAAFCDTHQTVALDIVRLRTIPSPDGQISAYAARVCLSSIIFGFSENIVLPAQAKSVLDRCHPVPHKGRFAIVTDVGTGGDGRGSVWRARTMQGEMNLVSIERRAKTRDVACGRRSRVVLTPRRWRQVRRRFCRVQPGLAEHLNPLMTVTTSRSPGRARSRPLKPFACGDAGMNLVDLW